MREANISRTGDRRSFVEKQPARTVLESDRKARVRIEELTPIDSDRENAGALLVRLSKSLTSRRHRLS
jgi:hypothetical protein